MDVRDSDNKELFNLMIYISLSHPNLLMKIKWPKDKREKKLLKNACEE